MAAKTYYVIKAIRVLTSLRHRVRSIHKLNSKYTWRIVICSDSAASKISSPSEFDILFMSNIKYAYALHPHSIVFYRTFRWAKERVLMRTRRARLSAQMEYRWKYYVILDFGGC